MAGQPQLAELEPTLQLMRLLWGLDHSLSVASKGLERRQGFTERQRQILARIGAQPGVTAVELAAWIPLHPTTVAGILSRLRRRRLIATARDGADGRLRRLRLTESGRKATSVGGIEDAIQRALDAVPRESLQGVRSLFEAIMRELDHPPRGVRQAPNPADARLPQVGVSPAPPPPLPQTHNGGTTHGRQHNAHQPAQRPADARS